MTLFRIPATRLASFPRPLIRGQEIFFLQLAERTVMRIALVLLQSWEILLITAPIDCMIGDVTPEEVPSCSVLGPLPALSEWRQTSHEEHTGGQMFSGHFPAFSRSPCGTIFFRLSPHREIKSWQTVAMSAHPPCLQAHRRAPQPVQAIKWMPLVSETWYLCEQHWLLTWTSEKGEPTWRSGEGRLIIVDRHPFCFAASSPLIRISISAKSLKGTNCGNVFMTAKHRSLVWSVSGDSENTSSSSKTQYLAGSISVFVDQTMNIWFSCSYMHRFSCMDTKGAFTTLWSQLRPLGL
jgi:hypothetical protein